MNGRIRGGLESNIEVGLTAADDHGGLSQAERYTERSSHKMAGMGISRPGSSEKLKM